MSAERPPILCVDDEPDVLESLRDSLRRHFAVSVAGDAAQGLARMQQEEFAVVVSDMRMPGVDGAAFLAAARELAPATTRILLTGQTELAAAIAAVNQGQIFRFLTKPVRHEELVAALTAGAEQHRLVTAEKVLVEETLRGAVEALTEVLALAAPAAFGRAGRVKQYVAELARAVGHSHVWRAELAAMLLHVGYVSLPPELTVRIASGDLLSPDEQAALDRVAAVAEKLLSRIPRLEDVRAILNTFARPFDPTMPNAFPAEARMLRIAADYELLDSQGVDLELALATMRGRERRYDPALLDAFAELRGARSEQEVHELPLDGIGLGMIFAEDLRSSSGALLVARGFEVTVGLLERLRSFAPGYTREPVRMVVTVARDDDHLAA